MAEESRPRTPTITIHIHANRVIDLSSIDQVNIQQLNAAEYHRDEERGAIITEIDDTKLPSSSKDAAEYHRDEERDAIITEIDDTNLPSSSKENDEQRASTRLADVTETSEKHRVKENKWRPSSFHMIGVCVFACMIISTFYTMGVNIENKKDETSNFPVCNNDEELFGQTQTHSYWDIICFCLVVSVVSLVVYFLGFEKGLKAQTQCQVLSKRKESQKYERSIQPYKAIAPGQCVSNTFRNWNWNFIFNFDHSGNDNLQIVITRTISNENILALKSSSTQENDGNLQEIEGRLGNLTELSSSIEGKTKKSTKELINFCRCGLAGDHLSLLKKLTNNKFKIEGDKLNIEDANTLNLHQFKEIGHLISVHRMGVRIPPGINDEELAQLFGGFKEGKLNELDMSCSQNLTTQHFRILSEFIATNSIKILTLCGCELEGSYMDAFQEALSEKLLLQTINKLDLSFITTLEPKDYETIGKIVFLCKVKKITFDGCELNYRHLQHFEVSDLKEIVEMDLSCCENLSGKGFRILANIVANTGIECLILGGCKLNKTNIEAFYNELQLHKSTELKELNLGYNPTLEPDDFKTIGHIVALCKVEKITLAGCKLKESHLQKFKTCGFKLRTLDMGDNGYIGDGFTALAEIVEKFRLVELNISDCMINKSELQMFRKKLGKLKINRLNLSDYDRSPDESYIKEVCQLLPNVTDIIYLEFKNLTISCRRRLQCELNKLPVTATEIRLTDETIRWQGTAKCIYTS